MLSNIKNERNLGNEEILSLAIIYTDNLSTDRPFYIRSDLLHMHTVDIGGFYSVKVETAMPTEA
jgi:hypothetical protein